MPVDRNMKGLVLLIIGLSTASPMAYATEDVATICRSEADEQKFREIADGSVEILGVCPKKGLYFVEVRGAPDRIDLFKNYVEESGIRIRRISDYRDTDHSRIIMVEFEY